MRSGLIVDSAEDGKAGGAKGYQFSYHTGDNGDVTVLRGDPESGKVENVATIKGVGARRKDPDAQPAVKPPSAGPLRTVAQKKGDALAKAEGEFQKDVQTAVTPEDRQAALGNLTRAKQAAQNEYEEGLSALTGHDVPHFDYSQQPPAQASGGGRGAPQASGGAGGAPAQPRAAQSRGKLTDQDVSRSNTCRKPAATRIRRANWRPRTAGRSSRGGYL